MNNIRKIVLLSALLIFGSSVTASALSLPGSAISDDEQGVSAPRVIHAQVPNELTQDMIQDIRKNGRFWTATKEYVLQNIEQLEDFANFLKPKYSSFKLTQSSFMTNGELHYLILENHFSGSINPKYESARPEATGPQWIGHCMEHSRLIFKEQDLAPAKPLTVAPKVEEQEIGFGTASSVQVPMSNDSSSEDAVKAMIIRNLSETYKSNPEALEKAFVAFFANLK